MAFRNERERNTETKEKDCEQKFFATAKHQLHDPRMNRILSCCFFSWQSGESWQTHQQKEMKENRINIAKKSFGNMIVVECEKPTYALSIQLSTLME